MIKILNVPHRNWAQKIVVTQVIVSSYCQNLLILKNKLYCWYTIESPHHQNQPNVQITLLKHGFDQRFLRFVRTTIHFCTKFMNILWTFLSSTSGICMINLIYKWRVCLNITFFRPLVINGIKINKILSFLNYFRIKKIKFCLPHILLLISFMEIAKGYHKQSSRGA